MFLPIYSSAQKDEYSKIDTVWRIPTEGYTTQFPYIDNDLCVVGDEMGYVYGLNPLDGKTKWKYRTGTLEGRGKDGAFHTIVGDNNNLYFNSCGSVVVALDKKTGEEKWRYYEARFDDDIFTRIIQTENTLVLNTLVPSVLCINKQTGKKVWEYKEFSPKAGPSAVVYDGKNNVYFTSSDSILHCLNVNTGDKNWILKTNTSTSPFGPVVYDDKIVVNRMRMKRDTIGTVECYRLNDRKLLWSSTDKPSLYFGHGKNLVSFGPNGIKCQDAASSKEKWKIDGRFMWYTAPVFRDGNIYYQNRLNNTFFIIEEETGKIIKLFPMEGKTYTVPVVTDNFIYFGLGKTYNCMKR